MTTEPLPPVFLVCCERSGSTMTRHMLDHHPDIAWNGSFTFAVDLIDDGGRWPRLNDYYRHLEIDRVFRSSDFTIDKSLDYPALVHDFVRQYRERSGKRIVGANVHRKFDQLPRLFPSCRFIHLVRDGRDVSRSWVDMGWAGNAWSAAERWQIAERCWESLRNDLPAGRYHEVRYESLVQEPAATLRGICDFIGVPYSDRMLSYPRDTRYTPPDAELIGQWRARLSPREAALVEARIGPLLRIRGYATAATPPPRVGRARRLWLREHDRYGRLRARVRRNGWLLVFADILARYLRLRPLARRTQLQINAIATKHLK